MDVTERGIGFQDVQQFNLALLAKQRTKLSMDSMLRNIAYEEYSSKWYFLDALWREDKRVIHALWSFRIASMCVAG